MSNQHDPVTAASIEAAKAGALDELRKAAEGMADQKGHVLGMWHDLNDDGSQRAYCRRCWRSAFVDVERDPHIDGPAISEACGSTR